MRATCAARLILTCAAALLFEAGFLGGFAHSSLWVRALTGLTLCLAVVSQSLMARWMNRSVIPALMFPFGVIAMACMTLRSGVLVWRRGGVDWRGTVYSIDQLRAGSRLKIT